MKRVLQALAIGILIPVGVAVLIVTFVLMPPIVIAAIILAVAIGRRS